MSSEAGEAPAVEPLAPAFTTPDWIEALDVRLKAIYQDFLVLQARLGSDAPQAVQAARVGGGAIQDSIRSLDHVRSLWRVQARIDAATFADSLPEYPKP